MKLMTNNGELELPADFSFEIELNNPFLSDEGDASVPATIPATPNNLKVLDNIHRVDRANRFMKTTPASLTAGTVQKHGQLIIDTLSMRDGITVSLAVENSDLYSQYKEKPLKEIFASKVRDEWERDISRLMEHIESVRSKKTPDDFTAFQVAVSPYEENEVKTYQYNNEGMDNLIWKARTVRENDIVMSVTDGYGVSLFLYLHRLISLLFEQMGYSVNSNCLAEEPYKDIVMLNNCSDAIVKGVIRYSDLVPSCTLSDFIGFLFNKFGIHVRVNSTSKTADIVMLQDLLKSAADMDISGKVIDDLKIVIEDTSRVVLSSETSIDGTAPAAETFDRLMEKYGYYVEVSETEYNNILDGDSSDIADCLVMRRETGQFYELRHIIGSDEIDPKFIGTDYFKYDRENSANSESLSSIDVMPAMIYDYENMMPVMYIGDRLHHNTTYDNGEENTEQPIMIAWETLLEVGDKTIPLGTNRKYFRNKKIKDFSLTAYDMYNHFWSNYNNLLRNGKITLKGTVLYDARDIASLDMTKIKFYRGQKLLPLKTAFEVSDRLKNGQSEFLLVKDFTDMDKDTEIIPEGKPKYKWEQQIVEIVGLDDFLSYYPLEFQGNYMNVLHNFIVELDRYTVTINASEDNMYVAAPKSDGEKTPEFTFDCTVKSFGKVCLYDNDVIGQTVNDHFPAFNSRSLDTKITVRFQSVSL